MRMRRALALLCALCCIWSSLFSAAYAVDTLEDLGIDPWGDLGQLPDTVIQTPDPELAGVLDGLIQNQIGGGEGPSYFSIITDDHSYLVSTSNPFVIRGSNGSSGETVSWNNYSAPSQIGSGGENMFGTTNLFSFRSYQTGTTYSQSFSFADITLSCDLEIPENAEKLNLDGSISFLYGLRSASNPTTPTNVDKNVFQSCRLTVLGQSFSGVFDSTTNIFNFKISDIALKDFEGTSLPISIKFSGSVTGRISVGSTLQYVGIRFMFTDGVNATFTVSETPGGGFDEESKGLLRTIVDGVKAIVTGIIEMPGKIASAILDGLKGLFVPSAEEITAIKESYEDLLSERLGFIWQAGEWITSFGSDLLSALSGGAEAEFLFPGVGFDMNGERYQLIEQQAVDFDSNGIVTVIRPFVGTIVAFVVVIACVNLFHDMVAALISGKNYFDFLKGGGDG